MSDPKRTFADRYPLMARSMSEMTPESHEDRERLWTLAVWDIRTALMSIAEDLRTLVERDPGGEA